MQIQVSVVETFWIFFPPEYCPFVVGWISRMWNLWILKPDYSSVPLEVIGVKLIRSWKTRVRGPILAVKRLSGSQFWLHQREVGELLKTSELLRVICGSIQILGLCFLFLWKIPLEFWCDCNDTMDNMGNLVIWVM